MTVKHTPVRNHREIANKLADQLRPSGWYDLLKGFLVSEEFERVVALLDHDVTNGKRFTPVLKNVFAAFTLCPLEKLRVVLLNTEPYDTLNLSDGTAFGCAGTTHKHPHLYQVLRSANDTVHGGNQLLDDMPANLHHWAKQGVLLLNKSLTTEIGKPGKHFGIWDAFITYLIDMLNTKHPELVWILIGEKVEPLEELLDDGHLVLFCKHPGEDQFMLPAAWDCDDVFNKANRALNHEKKGAIEW